MIIEFDEVWVKRAEVQLKKALTSLENRDIKKSLHFIARALSNLQSGLHQNDGWAVYMCDKLDYSATLLDDAVNVLKEKEYKLIKENGEGGG